MKKINSVILVVTIAMLVFCQVHITFATTILRLSVDERIERSTDIVHAVVINKESGPSEDGKTAYTYITFKTIESLKGNKAHDDEFILTFEGGEMPDGSRLTVVGMPVFEINDDCILFIGDESNTLCPLTGWHQGLFRVLTDKDGNYYIADAGKREIIDITNEDAIAKPGIQDKARPKPRVISSSGIPSVLVEDNIPEEIKNANPLTYAGFKDKLLNIIANPLPKEDIDTPQTSIQPSNEKPIPYDANVQFQEDPQIRIPSAGEPTHQLEMKEE